MYKVGPRLREESKGSQSQQLMGTVQQCLIVLWSEDDESTYSLASCQKVPLTIPHEDDGRRGPHPLSPLRYRPPHSTQEVMPTTHSVIAVALLLQYQINAIEPDCNVHGQHVRSCDDFFCLAQVRKLVIMFGLDTEDFL